jgi:hypothetical protein
MTLSCNISTGVIPSEASHDRCCGCSHARPNLEACRTLLILAHVVRPEMAAMLAALAFGGAT